MFAGLLGNLNKTNQGPEEELKEHPEEDPKETTLMRAMGKRNTVGLNLLANSNLLSDQTIKKLQQYKHQPETIKVTEAVKKGNLEVIDNLALSKEFKEDNKNFVQNGQIVVTAFEYDQFGIARKLINYGYYISPNIILEKLNEENYSLVKRIISEKFFNPEHIVLEFWYMLYLNLFELAELLRTKENSIDSLVKHRTISETQENLAIDPTIMAKALEKAIERQQDPLACLIISLSPQLINKTLVYSALEHSCIDFLKMIWTGHLEYDNLNEVKKRQKESLFWTKLEEEVLDREERKLLSKSLKLGFIVDKLLCMEKVTEAYEVLKWPGAIEEPGVIKAILVNGQESLAKHALSQAKGGVASPEFSAAFEKGMYQICLDMLRFKEARICIFNKDYQKTLVGLIEVGEYSLTALDMLGFIPNKEWHAELTKELCDVLEDQAKKSQQILVSRSPILYCALAAELLTKFSGSSLFYQSRCLSVAEDFKELGAYLEDSIKDEKVLRHHVLQEDSKGRSALTVIARNDFLRMLECDLLGVIINKLWEGPVKHHSAHEASTLHVALKASAGTPDSIAFMSKMDTSKPYTFQYSVWPYSCSLRFRAHGFATIVLLLLYTLLIEYSIRENTFDNVANNSTTVIFLRISQVLVCGILVDQGLQFIFAELTNRTYELDNWRVLDLVMFSTMIFIMAGFDKTYMGEGNTFENIEPTLFNALCYCLMYFIIWAKFLSVLAVSMRFGPFLRMLYLMFIEILGFSVIYICVQICFAAIFTSLFSTSIASYKSFSHSSRTLYSAALGAFSFVDFAGSNEAMGSVLLGLFLVIANVVLLNLLVALLTNVYLKVTQKVEATQRAVLVSYYNRWFWDENYGLLIFVPTPFNIFVLLLSSLLAFSKKSYYYNQVLLKVFYGLFAFVQFIGFFVASLAMLPLCYLKGFYTFGKAGNKKVIQLETTEQVYYSFSVLKCLAWPFVGVPLLLWAVFRDSYHFWSIVYKDNAEVSTRNTSDQFLDSGVIEDAQSVLQEILRVQVTVEEFVSVWAVYDNLRNQNTDYLETRQEQAQEFFMRFAESLKNPVISIERMIKLLPVQEHYDENYLKYVENINIPWLLSGLNSYHDYVGSMVMGGVSIPKELGKSGGPLDAKHVFQVKQNLEVFRTKYGELSELLQNLKSQAALQEKLSRGI